MIVFRLRILNFTLSIVVNHKMWIIKCYIEDANLYHFE